MPLKGNNNKFFEIGILLNVLGVSISIIAKELLGNDSSMITNTILILSVVLIVDWNSVFINPYMKKTFDIGMIVFLQCYIVVSAIFVGAPLSHSSNALVYTLYVIAFLFAIETNHTLIDEEFLIKAFLIASATLNVLALGIILKEGGPLVDLKQNVVELKGGAERSTLSGVPFYYIISFIACSDSGKKKKIWWLFLAISLINLFACNRRTVYVTILVCICVFYMKKMGRIKGEEIRKNRVLKVVIGFVSLMAVTKILLSIPQVSALVQSSLDSLLRGLRTFFSDEYGDASVLVRNRSRQVAKEFFESNSLLQWIFGRGYAFLWFDFPFAEAFLDLGIVQGLIYMYLFLILPISTIMKEKKMGSIQLLFTFGMISAMLSSFSSGMPYGYTKYCPLILFVHFVVQDSKSFYENAEDVYVD